MAANTCTSTTGVVSGSDPNFILTLKTMAVSGLGLLIKYTKGTETGVSITIDSIISTLSATDKYRHIAMSGAAVASYTFTLSASGNYRIPIELFAAEKTVCANITFASAGQGGAIIANFMEA